MSSETSPPEPGNRSSGIIRHASDRDHHVSAVRKLPSNEQVPIRNCSDRTAEFLTAPARPLGTEL